MRVPLGSYEPLLMNTVGHCAGALIFGIFIYLFLRDGRGARLGRSALPALAAALALLWNIGSLIVLADFALYGRDAIAATAFSFSVLSLLPAVLLSISLQGRLRGVQIGGYAISSVAIGLHIAEMFAAKPSLHENGLLLISVGFGILTTVSVLLLSGGGQTLTTTTRPRILGAMSLILLATSFLHFKGSHTHPWLHEIAFHHAGIPLALFVLLQDYRFLLLDAFVRLIANSILAVVLTAGAVALNDRLRIVEVASANPFLQGLLIVGACVGLIVFSQLRMTVQRWLTKVVFGRPVLNEAIQQLVAAPARASNERELLEYSAGVVARFAATERWELQEGTPADSHRRGLLLPQPVTDGDEWGLTASEEWVQAIVPLRFSRGDAAWLMLGRRAGGRRFLSEDLQHLTQLSLVVVGQVERFRSGEMQRLAAQAEMRALQAQINPHFLFNALNALYGTIPRNAEGARRTVLNLADIFRYFLQTDKTYIPVSEEVRIVRAYLEIEKLRLGERLEVELDIDAEAEWVPVPALCIQPIVENAVRHGVAEKAGPGKVSLSVRAGGDGLTVQVRDTGHGFEPPHHSGSGVGLQNVRQRLGLCYGSQADLRIDSGPRGTAVSFTIPVPDRTKSDVRSQVTAIS
jgi:hypothetical protein